MIRQYNPIRKGIGIIRRNKSSFTAAVFDRSEQLPVHMPPMKRAKGPYLYDYDENRYVDFELSRGSLLLGHAPAVLCSTMKSWLSRGYASGYPVVSNEMLAGKIQETVGYSEGDGRWLFYNSPFEAGSAALYIIKKFWKRERGVHLSDPGFAGRFSPFTGTMLVHGSSEKDIDLHSCGYDFAVLRAGRRTDTEGAERLVRTMRERGWMVVSDETDIEGHIFMSQLTGIADLFDMRVFGSFLASGHPFGSIFTSESAAKRVQVPSGYETFTDTASFSYSVPLYLSKAVIRYIGELNKRGGIGGFLGKTDSFFRIVGAEFFEMSGGLVYLKDQGALSERYPKVRLELLQNGFYFPLSTADPVAVSLTHSEELLRRCAGGINTLLKKYIR
jgi:hypothetical protein